MISMILILAGVGASMSRMTKNCVVCLAPKKVVFVSNEKIAEGGTRIWCELQQVKTVIK